MKYTIIKKYPLKDLIKSHKMTYRDASKKTGIEFSYLHRIANGKNIASEKIALKIINYFNNLPLPHSRRG